MQLPESSGEGGGVNFKKFDRIPVKLTDFVGQLTSRIGSIGSRLHVQLPGIAQLHFRCRVKFTILGCSSLRFNGAIARNRTGSDSGENQFDDHDRELSLPGLQPVTVTIFNRKAARCEGTYPRPGRLPKPETGSTQIREGGREGERERERERERARARERDSEGGNSSP